MAATQKELSYRAQRFLAYMQKKLGLSRLESQRRESRTSHIVQPDETLEGIAKEVFGDERFSYLIAAINRTVVSLDESGHASICAGQIIALPAQGEANVFHDTLLGQRSRKRRYLPRSIVASEVPSVNLVAPSTNEDSVDELSEVCRVSCSVRGSVSTQFYVKLQTGMLGSHSTIASYESSGGKTVRILYNRDGSSSQMQIDLPPEVVRDMAKRDFRRNWQRYYDLYFQTASAKNALFV